MYFTLDSPEIQLLVTHDPAGFVSGLPERVILDEVQLAPEIFRAIKLSIDQNRNPGRFILTGSANAMLIPHLSEALIGRSEILTLFPLAQNEIEGTPGELIDLAFEGELAGLVGRFTGGTRADLISRVVTGGFPEVVTQRRGARRSEWFQSYVTSLIQRDIRDLAEVESLAMLPRVLGFIAARSASLANHAELSRALTIPLTTLKRYLALFEVTFLTQTLPAWSGNLSKRLVRAPKVMMTDTGLLCHLLGVDEDRLVRDPFLLGPVLENFVYMEFKKLATWSRSRIQLMHFRTSADQKVDIVLERLDGSVVAVEVKAAATLSQKDFAGIELLKRELGDKFVAGLVFYTGVQVLPISKNTFAVPVSLIWSV